MRLLQSANELFANLCDLAAIKAFQSGDDRIIRAGTENLYGMTV
jgi:hypothetical protein